MYSKTFLLLFIVIVPNLFIYSCYALSNNTNQSTALQNLLEKAANYSISSIKSITNKFIDKSLVKDIANFSEYIADQLSKYTGITPSEAKLLEYYIFVLIIVFLADLISRFGKFIILVLGVIISALIFYNNPHHNFWAFIILAISLTIWFKK